MRLGPAEALADPARRSADRSTGGDGLTALAGWMGVRRPSRRLSDVEFEPGTAARDENLHPGKGRASRSYAGLFREIHARGKPGNELRLTYDASVRLMMKCPSGVIIREVTHEPNRSGS